MWELGPESFRENSRPFRLHRNAKNHLIQTSYKCYFELLTSSVIIFLLFHALTDLSLAYAEVLSG